MLQPGWTDADDSLYLDLCAAAVLGKTLVEDSLDTTIVDADEHLAPKIAELVEARRAAKTCWELETEHQAELLAARGDGSDRGLTDAELEMIADLARDKPTGAGGGFSSEQLDAIAALA